MKRKFRIVGVKVVEGFVVLDFMPIDVPKPINPEEVIEELPGSDEERVALKVVKALAKAYTKLIPGFPSTEMDSPLVTLRLTENEYRIIGAPTVYQTVVLEFNIKVE